MISLKTRIQMPFRNSFWKPLLFVCFLFAFTACLDDSEDPVAEQMKIDDAKIQAYIKENSLGEFQRTASGVYYKVIEAGNGTKPKRGDLVSVHYTLFNLTGKQIETSTNDEPIEFTLGIGQVIRGWDIGIGQLEEGSSAILLIPSPLAYGNRYMDSDMPANSVLRFDVELVAIN